MNKICTSANEEWRNVVGYEGLYQVSNSGKVRSHYKGEWKIISGCTTKYGYKVVLLYKDGVRKSARVHRLVALLFIPNPEQKLEVNHIDGNKENNDVSNLEWCSRSENEKHAHSNGLKPNMVKGKFGKDHIASRPFVCVETGKIYNCQRELAEELGGGMEGVSHITRACKYGLLDHGFHWRYYEPNEIVKLLFEKGYSKYPMSYDGDYWFCYVQMACKWLREVHNIHIIVFRYDNSAFPYIWYIFGYNNEKPQKANSYEEAVEAALKYTLENLL